MAGKTLRLVVLIAVLAPASYGFSQMNITSERLEHSGSVYEAEGSVTLKRGDARVVSDRARYDEDTSEVYAEGNVLYEDPDVTINADSALINFTRETGVIYNAVIFIKKDNYRIQSSEVWKTGEDRYFIRQATATTCDAPIPAWCLSGRDMDIIVGDRLKAKHALMRIKGIPVFYTPYIWAPILTERTTGFLMPVVGYRDSTGFYYRQPYFWAFAENQDATFYLDAYPSRGLGEGAEYRYVTGGAGDVKGSLNIYHFGDKDIDEDFYEFRTSHRLAGHAYLEVNYVNRRDFYRLYEPYLDMSAKRYVESKAGAQARLGDARLYITGRYFIDLREDVDESSVLQRLPEAGFFISPQRVGPMTLTASVSAANFTRALGVSGRRLNLNLRLTHSLGKGPYLSQSAGVLGSYYGLDDGSSIERRVFDYNALLHGSVLRRYGSLSHAVEGTLSYRRIGAGDEEPPLFDRTELIAQASRLELTVFNRLIGKQGEFVSVRVAEAYDFLNEDRPLTPLAVDASISHRLSLRASASIDPYEVRAETAAYEVGGSSRGVSVAAGQIYRRADNIVLYTFGLGWGGRRLSAEGRLMYDPEAEDELRELYGRMGYAGQCWALGLSAVKRPDDFSVFVTVGLTGLGSVESISYGPQEGLVMKR